MPHPLRCRCGTVTGRVELAGSATHAVCYCHDCQAYARFLGSPERVLDEHLGTAIVATAPSNVAFESGRDRIASMSLSPRGLLRWYADCCNTPLGNTPRDHRVHYVGLVHNCLESTAPTIDQSFGPVQIRINTKSGRDAPAGSGLKLFFSSFGLFGSLLTARLSGRFRKNPFFDAHGQPMLAEHIASHAERDRIYAAS
ncbi:MAG: DUF6151 family protein [Steroidobacteraceae bacterium]